MRPQPYVGITGFKTDEEVHAASGLFEQYGFLGSSYLPMFGFLVSEKRLNHPMQRGKESPAAAQLASLAHQVPLTSLPMMHYFTKCTETLAKQVECIFDTNEVYHKGNCRALQLNVNWPPIREIEKIKSKYLDLILVFQLAAAVTESVSLDVIAKKCKKYQPFAEYILIDPSGGFGIPFRPWRSIEIIKALHEVMPATRFGVAGGLSGENVEERLSTFKNGYNEQVCIDAQACLREKEGKENRLSIEKTRQYLANAAKMLL